MSSRPSRYLKRDWTHKKPHLAKYSSLPTLQLTPTERPIFQCHQCGFINTLIPMCLWCCWTSDAAHDEFYRSAPPPRRPRRLSAPPRVTTRTSISATPKSPPQNGDQYIPIPVEQQNTLYRGTDTTITTPVDNTPPGDAIGTATISTTTTTTTGKGPQSHSHRLRPSIPSFFLSQSDVDRPNPSTTGMKSINPKSSRFSLFLDFNSNHHDNGGRPDTKKTLDDDDERTSPTSGGGGGGGGAGAESPRTLRRKRRINIVEQAPQQLDVPTSAPIAISFDLDLGLKDQDDSRISSDFEHNSNAPYPAPPQTPPPPSSSPILPPPSSPTSSPIRIGHPTRPYYTAIRKNMSSPPASPSSSPPPSRPTSLSVPSASRPTSLGGPSPSRPTSLISGLGGEESFPPSSFHHNQRPISLCLGGMFSPFVIDTNTNTNADESPGPTSTSKNTLPRPKTTDRERGSIGFSMSGETELRMALAGIQAQTQTESRAGEFRYRETMTPSGSGKQDGERRKRGGSMSGVVLRVKAFRKSLKDLIGGPRSAV
ncbi:uncharacterized protein LACBIDRAFT_295101 [Laccaria bicolor S238N-H82]|uniref:Predicted protein n=1 Tax=Laccaria bicolor (strain S238N-H82 / ATCC MYA-4686) TaxID=486041 RepID=B0DN16_LACBS|nr:uncharacterized protein LACBIDRAFT_295101 [Laccaria bicolor S238N-H82]EDR04068.1 predicted protein [Laccaria bicolor S238N-H82]|eukprot:XP_001885323.1 predicted protein [Laccaria bicolor S238N-H82]